MKCFTIIYIFLLTAISAVAQQTDVAQIKQFCDARDYNSAINALHAIIEKDGASSALFYDLGNVCYKSGNYGAAVLNFNRALRVDPSNADARNNLLVVRQEVHQINEAELGDRNIEISPSAPTVFESIASFISSKGSNFWCIASIIIFFLCLVAAAVYMFASGVVARKIGFFGAGALLVISIAMLCCSLLSSKVASATDRGVLMPPSTHLLSSPAADSKEVASALSSGTEVKVLGTRQDADGEKWLQVSLNTDFTGWVKAEDVAVITL